MKITTSGGGSIAKTFCKVTLVISALFGAERLRKLLGLSLTETTWVAIQAILIVHCDPSGAARPISDSGGAPLGVGTCGVEVKHDWQWGGGADGVVAGKRLPAGLVGY